MRWSLLLFCLLATPAMAADNIVVVLDNSGSMKTPFGNVTRMDAAKTTLHGELNKIKADSKVGIVVLNPSPSWKVALAPIDHNKLHPIIDSIVPDGGTPLGGAMKLGADALLQLRSKEKYGTYRLLVITDGDATDNNLVVQYTPDIVSRGISVDVIGLNLKNHTLSKNVRSFKSADDQESLNKSVAGILAETSLGTDVGSEYELLQALPDGMADKVIEALVMPVDTPIGEPRKIIVNGQKTEASFRPNVSATQSQSEPSGFGGVMFILACVVIFAIVMIFMAQSL